MKIAIVGAGNVGRALAGGWRKAGHDVAFAVRDPASDKSKALTADGSRVVAMSGAAANADVVILAVPWPEIENAIKGLGTLTGKIVVDASNPLTKSLDLALGFSDSAGETVARLAKGARVVKAFNTTGAENMSAAKSFTAKAVMPVASDDADAKQTVRKLADDLGFESMDAGPLQAARYLEPMAMLWIKHAYSGAGTKFAYALTRR
ncbi:MAG TPA: NADPH-dependent F420 reductase [Pseudolabrys sp.]|nr:NADPH-dependent F420 reductase [Pseudolabrys sp.]